MALLSWISATVVVLGLILLLGRAARWVGARAESQAAARQRALWRVAPDARVRAVEVLGRVHLLYERGRESVVLESLDADDFETRGGEAGRGAPVVSLRGARRWGGR